MNLFPKVEVCFSIDGKFDLQSFYKKMEITDAKLRGPDDWPQAIKNNRDLPERLRPRYEWSFEIVENDCRDIKIPLKKLIDALKGKEEIIEETSKMNCLQHGFSVYIDESRLLPDISLSSEIIEFLYTLKTEIGIDINR